MSRSESRDEDPRFETADRLLGAAGHRLYSAATRRDDAAHAARAIRAALRASDFSTALRHLIQLNDDLLAESGLLRGVLAVAEPEPTGSRVWDAAIAALVAWRLKDGSIPTPTWVDHPSRSLVRPEVLRIDPADPDPAGPDVPDEFRARGVLVWRDTFASV